MSTQQSAIPPKSSSQKCKLDLSIEEYRFLQNTLIKYLRSRGYCRGQTVANDFDTEDVVEEVIIRVWRRVETHGQTLSARSPTGKRLEVQFEQLKACLFLPCYVKSICRHVLIDLSRKTTRTIPTVSLSEHTELNSSVNGHVGSDNSLLVQLIKILPMLTDTQNQVLLAVEETGSIKEAAKLLDRLAPLETGFWSSHLVRGHIAAIRKKLAT